MRKSKTLRQRRRAFTLIEVLLVVAILVALAAIAVPKLMGVSEGARLDEANLQVQNFKQAVELYQVNTGQFPSTEQGLLALVQPPNPPPENWRGPYIDNPNKLDPWGMPYNYQYPGTRNPAVSASGIAPPDIWSNGPDRTNGTQDDIGSWPKGY